MRVNRRFLYAGVFLVAVGGVLVTADLAAVDGSVLIDVLRLWPLVLVAIGVGIVLRRTGLSLAGGLVAAATPGLLIGSAFALGPRFVGDCGVPSDAPAVATESGRFVGPADVSVATGCGSLSITTQDGDSWALTAANSRGRQPIIDAATDQLEIASIGDEDWAFLDAGRDTWDLRLPTTELERLAIVVNVGQGDIALPGATIGALNVTANASAVDVNASEAALSDLTAVANAGQLTIALPATDITGSLHVGGGKITVCTPPGLGLRITSRGDADHIEVEGRTLEASPWESEDYSSSRHHADLTVVAGFGVVAIDPIGACS